jgi:hypothetical protein
MSHPVRLVSAIAIPLGVGTCLVVAYAPSSWRTSVSVYTTLMTVVSAVVLVVVLSDRARAASSVVPGARAVPLRDTEEAQLADQVQLAIASGHDFYYGLRPVLYGLACEHLGSSPGWRASDSERARATLGDAVWDRIRPDGGPTPQGVAGPTAAELSMIIQAIQRLKDAA